MTLEKAILESTDDKFYDSSYPYDEEEEEVEKFEEEAGESVLRNERDIILSRMNHGIQYENLELNNLL